MRKIKDYFEAFFSRVDDKTLLRHKGEEIIRLNNTIDELLKKQSRYHEQHVETSDKSLMEREEQLRREFESILRSKDNEIESIKSKYKSFWNMYEELSKRKVQLEKLKVSLSERINLAYSFTEESIKVMHTSTYEIDDFLSSMKKLEMQVSKAIPER